MVKAGDFGTGGFVTYNGNYSGSNRDVSKLHDAMETLKVYCPYCGHGVIFITGTERNICNHCGRYVYKNKEIERVYKQKEFRIRLQRKMKEKENE